MARLALLAVGGGGGDGGGSVHSAPGLALLDSSVDGHGAGGEVLELLDAGLAPEVGGGGQGSVDVTVTASDPGLGQQLLRRQPQGALLGQQGGYECPRHGGDVAPVLLWEGDLPLADVLEQHLLALLTVLSSLPTAVEAAVTGEWRIPTEEDVHDDPQTPHVARLVVAHQVLVLVVTVEKIVTHDEGVDHLGRHVLETADRREEVRCGDGDVGGVGAEVKITEFHRAGRVRVDTEDVVRLDVSVSDPSAGSIQGYTPLSFKSISTCADTSGPRPGPPPRHWPRPQ